MANKRVPLCFPVVYHGLFFKHTNKLQVAIVNYLLRGKYVSKATDDDYYSNTISKERENKIQFMEEHYE